MRKIIFIVIFGFNALIADELDFWHDGWYRECYIYKPSCISDNPSNDFQVPLVMMFHGLGGVGEDNYAFSNLAEDSCFIVAFPSGAFNTWNVGPEHFFSHDIDDNSYVETLIDSIVDDYPVDTNRVYGTGHSMGGAFMNHLSCTSTAFTATGSSGGWENAIYHPGNAYDNVCDPYINGYAIPSIHSHGIQDATIPVQWAQIATIAAANRNFCRGPLETEFWDLTFDVETDLSEMIDQFYSTADTIIFEENIHRYQWSDGCHTEPNTEVILLPNQGHAWHHPYFGSPINTPYEHWNFFRQFAKNEIAPALDSLGLPNGVNINDDYVENNETTPVRVRAFDNYSVHSMIISFLGVSSTNGFDLELSFNTDERLFNDFLYVHLDSNIISGYYETVQVIITDQDGNQRFYDTAKLQQLGLHQNMAVVNSTTVFPPDSDFSLIEPQDNHYIEITNENVTSASFDFKWEASSISSSDIFYLFDYTTDPSISLSFLSNVVLNDTTLNITYLDIMNDIEIVLADNPDIESLSLSWNVNATTGQDTISSINGPFDMVIDFIGTLEIKEKTILASDISLYQNFPNPFNPKTSIGYNILNDGLVSIKIYDISGSLVKVLCNEFQTSGYQETKWDGTNQLGQKVSGGLYIYQLEHNGYISAKKMVLTK